LNASFASCAHAQCQCATHHQKEHRFANRPIGASAFRLSTTAVSMSLAGASRRRHARQSTSLGGRRKRGDFAQAIGRSRAGRTTKLHGLADDQGRPRVLLLSSGNTNDISLAASHRKKCRRLEQELY
jgi:hypothetical protein